ncbi:coagulation factor V-like isoform X2 [Xenia sp. Carnegie-2017]|uniref:coagulation factor V-like isoform X2 n=1 Tax=Xenia sp. Carnegie-2017 TaxID=2897299 RepID=UPI001F033E99|nr:coagulation factor V-like isoform X2 [Xenia sp. Carnegie-2017]
MMKIFYKLSYSIHSLVIVYLTAVERSLFKCNHPLGVGDRQIADSQLTSPSFVSTLYIAKDDVYINAKPNYGRLNGKYAFCGGRLSYLQVNLSYVVNVTAVATQGLDDWVPSYVKTYHLRFSLNGQDWFNYSTPNKVWRGNINGRGIKRNNFNSSIQTQYLRFYPRRYNYKRCLRVEVYGCKSSDPGQSESTSTTTPLTTSVTDKKVTSVETDVTTPMNDAKVDVTTPKNDAKVTPMKAKDLSVTSQWKDIVTTEAPVLPYDVDHSKNNALLLGICIGGVTLITLTIIVFMLLKFKKAENRDADNRLVKKEFV